MLRRGHKAFLVFGDCYRRDEIDASHYPVFHQVSVMQFSLCILFAVCW